MGTEFARVFGSAGHRVVLGSRNPHKEGDRLRESGLDSQVVTIESAAYQADILILAVPGSAIKKALKGAGDLDNKILIDCTNPLDDSLELTKGFSTSNAEELADEYPKAKVVKAFNTIFAGVLRAGPDFAGRKAAVFYAGDDAASKEKVHALISELGFEPVDVGPLKSARYLEPLSALLVHLAYSQMMGTQLAVDLLRR